ncbi:MAG: L-glutamate gamma-semialdehyde dehydrogenase, partial [Sphingopyxis sp.]
SRAILGAQHAPIGPVICISPWNFPLAIFAGQVAAALVAGNTVLAKPAEETPLIAAYCVAILHGAGVPGHALQLVPGDGAVGAALVADARTAGVLFTGSTPVAKHIQAQLARNSAAHGRPIPFVAETGGQNAMIVDSSALAEQVVADALASAFDSAGQRCSALRILCVQADSAERVLAMVKGALAQWRVGNPHHLATDIGPVIAPQARDSIAAHIERMRAMGCAVHQHPLPAPCAMGTFIPPTIIEIDHIDQIGAEVFGPVLHVLRYRRGDLDGVIDAINATGYGLTFGLHTRIDATIAHVIGRADAGNLYINRNVIGAVVGTQPFGGRGLSGTGPKAGGPLYLGRLVAHAPQPDLPGCATPHAALAMLVQWLEQIGQGALADVARRGGAGALSGHQGECAGPVGEQNLYALHPRGRVLAVPRTHAGMVAQWAAALGAGNHVTTWRAGGMPAIWGAMPPPLAQHMAWVESAPQTGAPLAGSYAAVLIEPNGVADGAGAGGEADGLAVAGMGVAGVLASIAALPGAIP